MGLIWAWLAAAIHTLDADDRCPALALSLITYLWTHRMTYPSPPANSLISLLLNPLPHLQLYAAHTINS